MFSILAAGIAISAIVAYMVRKRTRLVAVTGILSSHGFSDDALKAIREASGEEEITITLADGQTFKTTAAEAAKRLQPSPDGKTQNWLRESSTNWLSLVLFVLGCALSVYLYALSKPNG